MPFNESKWFNLVPNADAITAGVDVATLHCYSDNQLVSRCLSAADPDSFWATGFAPEARVTCSGVSPDPWMTTLDGIAEIWKKCRDGNWEDMREIQVKNAALQPLVTELGVDRRGMLENDFFFTIRMHRMIWSSPKKKGVPVLLLRPQAHMLPLDNPELTLLRRWGQTLLAARTLKAKTAACNIDVMVWPDLWVKKDEGGTELIASALHYLDAYLSQNRGISRSDEMRNLVSAMTKRIEDGEFVCFVRNQYGSDASRQAFYNADRLVSSELRRSGVSLNPEKPLQRSVIIRCTCSPTSPHALKIKLASRWWAASFLTARG